ncbi:MAG: AraC family transcriptional regulator [Rhodospirillaceae bacterium]|nr:AraC family transcriptional regulator [Rhodospirillaceae bacterium]
MTAIIIGDPSIERLAGLADCSRRSLNRHLAVFDTTARTELLRVKLQIARQLLTATDLSLREIATLLGYNDAAAFTRAFRTGVGSAPSQWRSSQRIERSA